LKRILFQYLSPLLLFLLMRALCGTKVPNMRTCKKLIQKLKFHAYCGLNKRIHNRYYLLPYRKQAKLIVLSMMAFIKLLPVKRAVLPRLKIKCAQFPPNRLYEYRIPVKLYAFNLYSISLQIFFRKEETLDMSELL